MKCNVSFSEAGAGGIALDLSLDGPSHRGIATCALVRRMIQNYPGQLVPLVRVLKQWLLGLGLNDPYSGGLSSYGLVLMVVSFLQQHRQHRRDAGGTTTSERAEKPAGTKTTTTEEESEILWHEEWSDGSVTSRADLGLLLLGFLHTFGVLFDPSTLGVLSSGPLFDRRSHERHKLDPYVLFFSRYILSVPVVVLVQSVHNNLFDQYCTDLLLPVLELIKIFFTHSLPEHPSFTRASGRWAMQARA